MILSSVIIILGEVLEAAILTSLFLALSLHFKVANGWLLKAFLLGGSGAVIYASSFDMASEWFDGFGQEVINVSMLLGIYLCLLLFNTLIYLERHEQRSRRLMQWVMILCLSLAISREGFEIFLYLSGFYYSETLDMPVITGSIVGGSIGLSVGVLIYHLFINMNRRLSLYFGYSMLLLLAAGIILQATSLLIQIDWLPAQETIWDASGWLDESSVTGTLLTILTGYEATPTLIEVQCYIAAMLGIILTTALSSYYFKKNTR